MRHAPPLHGSTGRPRRSLDDRLRMLPRAASGIIVLLLTVAVGGQLLATRRLDELQRRQLPALEEVRTLAAELRLVHAGLGSRATDVAHVVQGEEAEAVARHAAEMGQSAAVRDLGARVERYLAEAHDPARRANDGGTSLERDYEGIEGDLTAVLTSTASEAGATLAGVRTLQLSATLALLLGGGATLLLVSLVGVASRRSVDRWVEQVTETVCALADGAFETPIPRTEEGAAGRLHDGLRRLACELRESAVAAFPATPGARRARAASAGPEPLDHARQLADVAPRCDEGRAPILLKEDRFDLSYAAVTPRGPAAPRDGPGARLPASLEGHRPDVPATTPPPSAQPSADITRF